MKLFKNKRGQVGLREIPTSVLFLVLAGVIGVIGLVLMDSIDDADAVTAGSFAANASLDAQEGVAEVYENFDLIGLMIGLGAVLVILLVVFGFIARRGV